ncbi:hypothetical protein G6F56_012900 [Rhizopus delemar]|nr:hypothetical protein G6F56_012900 [Rhizopus delemar]
MFKRKQSPTTESTTKKQKNKKDQVWHLVFLDALEAHKQSRFEDALSLFTRALSMQPDHLSILDGRSSCDERLGHYDRAMTDAKRMIQVAPQDARGYLRAGRLLTLQKQLKAAHKVYNAGLSQVSSEDKRYSSIKDLQTSIDRELAERLDFISILPFDVKAMIFAYMPFSRRLRCLQVSRGWRDFALRWGGMWRDLDFGDRKVGQVVVGRTNADG